MAGCLCKRCISHCINLFATLFNDNHCRTVIFNSIHAPIIIVLSGRPLLFASTCSTGLSVGVRSHYSEIKSKNGLIYNVDTIRLLFQQPSLIKSALRNVTYAIIFNRGSCKFYFKNRHTITDGTFQPVCSSLHSINRVQPQLTRKSKTRDKKENEGK